MHHPDAELHGGEECVWTILASSVQSMNRDSSSILLRIRAGRKIHLYWRIFLSTLRVVPRFLVPLVVRLNLHVRVETTLEVEFSTRSIWYSYHVEMDRRVLIYNESLTLKGRNCLDLGMCSHLGL